MTDWMCADVRDVITLVCLTVLALTLYVGDWIRAWRGLPKATPPAGRPSVPDAASGVHPSVVGRPADRRHSRKPWMPRDATPQLCLAVVLAVLTICWLVFGQPA